jgi:SAM-dependent methyltransferase
MDRLWSALDLIQCITLRERPERRAAAEAVFAAVGLAGRVEFLEQDRDTEDGKRGCFRAHQQAAQRALEQGARRTLIFEDDVEFLPHFSEHLAARATAFLCDVDNRASTTEWSIFFLGHFPKKMELTERPDIVRVRSMDAHAYVLSPAGAEALCKLTYKGEQVDVHFHYENAFAYALYPMVAVQTPGESDTEGLRRADDWNEDKLARERELYQNCVSRMALARAMGQSTDALVLMGAVSGGTVRIGPTLSVTECGDSTSDFPSRHLGATAPLPAGSTRSPDAVCSSDAIVGGAHGPSSNTFEWVAGWRDLESRLSPASLGLASSARVVDIGCGVSTLPLCLAQLYRDVTGLDREAHCVTMMTDQYGETDRLRWRTCDICDADDLARVNTPESADLVVDKGTLDCAIVEHDTARLLRSVDWLLSPGGAYVVISFRKKELLLALLTCQELGWTVEHAELPMAKGEPASCCTLRKAAAETLSGACGRRSRWEELSAHVQTVVDWWYTQESPLLTAERE